MASGRLVCASCTLVCEPSGASKWARVSWVRLCEYIKYMGMQMRRIVDDSWIMKGHCYVDDQVNIDKFSPLWTCIYAHKYFIEMWNDEISCDKCIKVKWIGNFFISSLVKRQIPSALLFPNSRPQRACIRFDYFFVNALTIMCLKCKYCEFINPPVSYPLWQSLRSAKSWRFTSVVQQV